MNTTKFLKLLAIFSTIALISRLDYTDFSRNCVTKNYVFLSIALISSVIFIVKKNQSDKKN